MWRATPLFVCPFLLTPTHPQPLCLSPHLSLPPSFPPCFTVFSFYCPVLVTGETEGHSCVPFQFHLPKQVDCAGCLVRRSRLQISQPRSDAAEFHFTESRTHFLVTFASHKENLKPRKYGLPESLNCGRHIYGLLWESLSHV